ncbi:MAG: NAD(P)H-hydrate epimerase [Acidobacteria bacterium]|nr:NAD(P)H-hydrate epimerase [Acidobacteriota bacterium]
MSTGPTPTLTSAQAAAADRICSERFGIPLEWLMEAAGWAVARACAGPVAVMCGRGNNGGDGFAAARHLHRWGRLQSVSCMDRSALRGSAADEATVLERLGIAIETSPRFDGAGLIVDALLGTGLNRAPEGRLAEWITAINASGLPVLAVDLPSGLDADTGQAYSPCIKATQTITFGLPKVGLTRAAGPNAAGEVIVADIGIPWEAYDEARRLG